MAVTSEWLSRPFLTGYVISTGTLYVDTTMSRPDKDATIQCVCAVIRAHIVNASKLPKVRASPRHATTHVISAASHAANGASRGA